MNAMAAEKLDTDVKLDFVHLTPHIATEVRGLDLRRAA